MARATRNVRLGDTSGGSPDCDVRKHFGWELLIMFEDQTAQDDIMVHTELVNIFPSSECILYNDVGDASILKLRG